MKIKLVDLKPAIVFRTLICCNYLNKPLFPKTGSWMSSCKVVIEGRRVELCKSIYLVYVTVNAVAHNCINQSIICCYRNSSFRSSLCQRVEPWIRSISKNYRCNTLTYNEHMWNISIIGTRAKKWNLEEKKLRKKKFKKSITNASLNRQMYLWKFPIMKNDFKVLDNKI